MAWPRGQHCTQPDSADVGDDGKRTDRTALGWWLFPPKRHTASGVPPRPHPDYIVAACCSQSLYGRRLLLLGAYKRAGCVRWCPGNRCAADRVPAGQLQVVVRTQAAHSVGCSVLSGCG